MATERAVDRDFRTTKVYPQFNGYYYVTSGSVHLHPALSMLTSTGSPAMAARVLRGYPQSNACGIKILWTATEQQPSAWMRKGLWNKNSNSRLLGYEKGMEQKYELLQSNSRLFGCERVMETRQSFISAGFTLSLPRSAPCGTEQTTIDTGCDPALPCNCIDHPADCNLFKTTTLLNSH